MITETKTFVTAFTKEEVYEIIEKLKNPCDKFIVLAAFEGLFTRPLCKYTKLTLSDSNVNKNGITFHDRRDDTTETFQVSQELMELAVKSANTYTYERYNGDIIQFDKESDSDSVFKSFSGSAFKHPLGIDINLHLKAVSRILFPDINFKGDFMSTLRKSGELFRESKSM